jgi:hypothetical protein
MGHFDDFDGVFMCEVFENGDDEHRMGENVPQFKDNEVFQYNGLDESGRKTSTFGSFESNGCFRSIGFIATWEDRTEYLFKHSKHK